MTRSQERQALRRGIAIVVGALVTLASIVFWSPPALAHTAFESSEPADGETVDAAVEQITITFTGAAEQAGDGFEVLAADGVLITPTVEVSQDQRVFTLRMDEPLVAGTIGVRWSVRAGDAHPIEGSFSFTTTAPAPTPPPTPAPTVAVTPAVEPAAISTAPPVESATAESDPNSVAAGQSAPRTRDLDSFLDIDNDQNGPGGIGRGVGFIGRALTMVGSVLAVGVASLAMRWRRYAVAVVSMKVLAPAAAIAALGAGFEGLGFILDDATSVLNGQQGVALGLRLLGAAVVAFGALQGAPKLAVAGSVALVASFAFDGHTVTKGNRALTAVADLVHVGAASIWIGGIALLVLVARSGRTDMQNELPELAAKFSVLASIAIGVVGAAGIALTVSILGSFSDLWNTSWGRTLLAKTAAVAIALGLGAYNHFRLVPAIEADQTGAVKRFRQTIRTELMVLVVVAILTAVLVAGAS